MGLGRLALRVAATWALARAGFSDTELGAGVQGRVLGVADMDGDGTLDVVTASADRFTVVYNTAEGFVATDSGADGSVAAVAARLPAGVPVYITIDIDAFCPSIAPGTGTPSHGGFLYYEVLELLQGVARAHPVVGIDLVEVAPAYDPSGSTAILAAQLLLNLLGVVFDARG